MIGTDAGHLVQAEWESDLTLSQVSVIVHWTLLSLDSMFWSFRFHLTETTFVLPPGWDTSKESELSREQIGAQPTAPRSALLPQNLLLPNTGALPLFICILLITVITTTCLSTYCVHQMLA